MAHHFSERILFPARNVQEQKLRASLSGKTIVVTGASSGIGYALCVLLSRYDTHLVLIARNRNALLQLAALIEANGSRASIIIADLYEEPQIDETIRQLLRLDRIDLFISNAGKSIMRSLAQSLPRYHDITRTNTLNYLAPARMLLALTPVLAAHRGTIVNVSALNVLLLPAPMWAAYQASKTAFDQWFRCNQAEWKQMRIHAKSIYFPLVRTRMIAPNPKYAHAPAMEAEQAAIRIARLLYSRRSVSKPWWSIVPQLAGFFGKGLWNWYCSRQLSRNRS